MELGIQVYVSILLWNYLLACGPCLIDPNEKRKSIEYTIINLNGEQMEVLWDTRKNLPDMNVTMFYKFDYDKEFNECPKYILDHGSNTGCLFKTDGKHLYISIRDANKSEEFYYDEQKIKKFFKPNPPENITFQWADDTVTALYNPPKFSSTYLFDLEFEYKSKSVSKWQERTSRCCKITVPGFDPEKCYLFRFRLKMSRACDPICYASEWGPEMYWKNGSSMVSCAPDISKEPVSEPVSNTIILLVSVMGVFLVIFTILVCVCSLERIRKIIMPEVPDPKHLYSELFTDHNGNFQDWIYKTQNVFVGTQVEHEEEECTIEENVQRPTVEAKVGTLKRPVV